MTGPIVVVGPSRSGTAMTRALLNRHPDIGLAGETHYFDDLRLRFHGRASTRLTADRERCVCEDYFLALSHRPYGHAGDPERGWMTRSALRAEAESRGGGPDAHFEAFCRLEAARVGAGRWGEKTPRHVFRIPQIVGRYPEARIVCLVRDPRAVVASYRDWRNQGGFDLDADPDHARVLEREHERTTGSYHPAVISLLWNGQVKAMVDARERYGPERVRIQRYEDLVVRGRLAVEELCAWVGVGFDERMLEVPMQNSSFARYDRARGLAVDGVDRWRGLLTDAEVAMVQAICGGQMRRFGYERAAVAPSRATLVRGWSTLPAAAVRAVRANRHRTGSLPRYVARRLRLVVGSLGGHGEGG